MYFVVSNNKMIMADKEFLSLFEYEFFQDLIDDKVLEEITFNHKIAYMSINNKLLRAKYSKINLITNDKNINYLIKFEDIKFTDRDIDHLEKFIYIDLSKISNDIGLSTYDYKLYLDDFIDQSILNENNLLKLNIKVINNLLKLSSTLKIPKINMILEDIKNCEDEVKREDIVNFFYNNLNLLSFTKQKKKNFDWSKKIKIDIDTSKNISIGDDIKIIKNSHNLITLDNIQALDIDYDPSIASTYLDLPISLIEEFINDLIEENKLDRVKLLNFYNNQDINNINTIAHKLKGATSNLKIDKLTNILTKMQYSTDFEDLKLLFYEYAGLFLGLEKAFKKKL